MRYSTDCYDDPSGVATGAAEWGLETYECKEYWNAKFYCGDSWFKNSCRKTCNACNTGGTYLVCNYLVFKYLV